MSVQHNTTGSGVRRSSPTPAQRGDLAIVVTQHHDYVRTFGGRGDGGRYHVAVVTSITRGGRVKRVQLAGRRQPEALDRIDGMQSVLLFSQHDVDVAAVVAVAAARSWSSGAPGRPYETLTDAAAVVRAHPRGR